MNTWISVKTIETFKMLACELIDTHAAKMNMAFLRADDGKLKVGLSFDVVMSEKVINAVDVAATITYMMERVKDKIEKNGISEIQVELFSTAAEGKVQ